MSKSRCKVCNDRFDPVVENQQFCSGTCARAVRDIDELGRVYAIFDRMHLKAWLNRKELSGKQEGR